MAEALVNVRGMNSDNGWQAYSAGTRPTGEVHPLALQVLVEIGIHHQGISRKPEDLPIQDFDKVVTVCDSANDDCPLWLGKGVRVHRPFFDPAKTNDILDFRRVRDEINASLDELLT